MAVTEENVLALIPQRPPFVMIGQLLSSNTTTSVTIFEVKAENILVEDGQLSEAGLIENIAQAAAAGLGYLAKQSNGAVQVGYIAAIKNLKVLALPRVGDVIKTTVSVDSQVFEMTTVTGAVYHNSILLAQCEMKIFVKSNATIS